MGELRYDRHTDDWVIVAPQRGRRPGSGLLIPRARQVEPMASLGSRDENCPFCPGNESLTPAPVYHDGEGGSWRIRVVPNRFPALAPEVGAHEVIVESPKHGAHLAGMSLEHLEAVLAVYRARYTTLLTLPRTAYVSLFRNQGVEAGASQAHPHAQVIAMPVVPSQVERRWEAARRFYREHGRCLLCDTLRREEEQGLRWVNVEGDIAVFCPHASRYPYEMWLAPQRHEACFTRLTDAQLPGLASLLRGVLRGLNDCLGDVPFNVLLHSGPSDMPDAPHYHWYLQIAPRIARVAGFELNTGMNINPKAPEEAAADLRTAVFGTD